MNDAEFHQLLWHSSVQLVQLDRERQPVDFASGCLIDYSGERILLTVAHATGDQKNWAIQDRYVPGSGTEMYQLGSMHFLAKTTLPGASKRSTASLREVDFSYVRVPSDMHPHKQEIEPSRGTGEVASETPVTVHSPSLEESPDPEGEFGFAGMVFPEREKHFGQDYLAGEPIIYPRLSFSRTEGDYHVFSLPHPHPGHDYFRGCSGAPILSREGSLVALVCKGDKETDEIFGISTAAYKPPIDILAQSGEGADD